MKHYRRYRAFLDTVYTLATAGAFAFLCWWLWQILPYLQMLVAND